MKKLISILLCLVILSGSFITVTAVETDNTSAIFDVDTYYFDIEVDRDGSYTVLVEYTVSEVRGSDIECNVYLDGAADGVTYFLENTYIQGTPTKDSSGNELTPEYLQYTGLKKSRLSVATAFYISDGVFTLTKGIHNIGIKLVDDKIGIDSVTVIPYDEVPSYDEYLKMFDGKKDKGDTQPVTVQAENVSYATSKVVIPFCDSSSAHVTPVADRLQVMNALGGQAWNLIGQEAVWEIDIKESGWYSLSIRYRQDYTDGRATVRGLKIDGETPFKECEQIEFPYVTKWKSIKFGSDDTVYAFYLEKGRHTISLTPALGEMGKILSDVQNVLTELNAIYRKIIMITSSTPDAYRDYRLNEKIPDTIKKFNTESENLQKLIDAMPDGTNCSLLKRTVDQMRKMYKQKNTIAGELNEFQSNLSSIGTWINDQKTQSLTLDEITVYPSNKGYEKKSVGVFYSLFYQIKRFVYSFAEEYVSYDGNDESIEVWVSTGRDQMQIIRRLANESFTAKTGIHADLKIIATAALLPAVVAGIGPDVALGEANTTPVNFASRGAMHDLSKFDDADEIISRFADAAIVPLQYDGGLYALPETLNFNMLFYRTDIFEEYGWKVPETWDDVRNLIFDLSKNNMEQMIPDAMIEAAQIDGANGWTIFMRIVMPMVKPAWLTLIIFSFQNLWNNTGGSFIFTENLKTLPNALSNIVAGGVARTGSAAAVALIMVIPPVVVFIVSQSNVIETMGSSGLKE